MYQQALPESQSWPHDAPLPGTDLRRLEWVPVERPEQVVVIDLDKTKGGKVVPARGCSISAIWAPMLSSE
jgi:hypothetical protein